MASSPGCWKVKGFILGSHGSSRPLDPASTTVEPMKLCVTQDSLKNPVTASLKTTWSRSLAQGDMHMSHWAGMCLVPQSICLLCLHAPCWVLRQIQGPLWWPQWCHLEGAQGLVPAHGPPVVRCSALKFSFLQSIEGSRKSQESPLTGSCQSTRFCLHEPTSSLRASSIGGTSGAPQAVFGLKGEAFGEPMSSWVNLRSGDFQMSLFLPFIWPWNVVMTRVKSPGCCMV
jgi:hypothetical protein